MTDANDYAKAVTAEILAIQEADTPPMWTRWSIAESKEILHLDIPCNYRGASAGMNLTYLEIAKELGMEGNKFPESNVKDLCNRSLVKLIRNFIFILISEAAIKNGFSEEDAIDFSAQAYRLDKQLGKTDAQILARWL